MKLELLFESFYKSVITIGINVLISIERENHSHPGGVVTHLLVGLGACIYSFVSVNIEGNADPSRIAAQVVSGMGFLGSATVIKSDKYVKGINTAANLWVAAGVGLSVGMGMYEMPIILGIFIPLILLFSNKIYKWKRKREKRRKKELTENINKKKQIIKESTDNIVKIHIQKEIDEELEEEDERDKNFDFIDYHVE